MEAKTLDVQQHIDINKPIADVFEKMLSEFSDRMQYPDGRSMDMRLEAQPGGRWYRDLGDGAGHLWGTVQSLKRPALLEITGQMFMSYPVMNHMEVKLEEIEGGTRVNLRHRALGLIPDDHIQGVGSGWGMMLKGLKENCEA